MTRMHNPPHPGEILEDTVLRSDGGLSMTRFAKWLDISRMALSRVVNGRAAVSRELAIRLAAALGGSAESWLRMQIAYDLWQAHKRRRPKIEPLGSNQLAEPREDVTLIRYMEPSIYERLRVLTNPLVPVGDTIKPLLTWCVGCEQRRLCDRMGYQPTIRSPNW
jgi:addiction module HigA family antidote